MNKYLIILLVLTGLLFSCKKEGNERREFGQREEEKREKIFAEINKAWKIKIPVLEAEVQNLVADWAQWRLLMTELNQKPSSSLGAFQKKASTLSKKVADVTAFVPQGLDKPEIRSRLLVLQTKINSLDLFINLDEIPVEKVKITIAELNEELKAISLQLKEMVIKSHIRTEEGESELLEMIRDTTRAVRELPKNLEEFE